MNIYNEVILDDLQIFDFLLSHVDLSKKEVNQEMFIININILLERVDYQYLLYFHLYLLVLNTYLVHKHPLLAFEVMEFDSFQNLD